MKTTITASFDFSEKCKQLIKDIYEKNTLSYTVKVREAYHENLYGGNMNELVRFENFGIVNSSDEYEDSETIVYKCWLTEIGKAFYRELFEGK
mgnify:CR=1 FL=1